MNVQTASVLEITDLTVARAGAALPELDRFSLTLNAGETVIVLGETGCGKEALLRAVSGTSRPDERVSGLIRFGNLQASPAPGRHGSGIRVAFLPCMDQAVLSP